MFKPLIKVIKARGRAKRFETYALLLEGLQKDAYKSSKLPGRLNQLWRFLNLDDITNFTTHERMILAFSLRHSSVVTLVNYLEFFNTEMAEGRDSNLELMAATQFKTYRSVELDLYFADENKHSIDVKATLTRLKSLIMIHNTLLEGFDNQFFQRQAHDLYIELLEMTRQLISMANHKEFKRNQ